MVFKQNVVVPVKCIVYLKKNNSIAPGINPGKTARLVKTLLLNFFMALLCAPVVCLAQQDSTIASLQQIPLKYIHAVDNKIDKYSNRITGKTEKTLAKLSKWENKI